MNPSAILKPVKTVMSRTTSMRVLDTQRRSGSAGYLPSTSSMLSLQEPSALFMPSAFPSDEQADWGFYVSVDAPPVTTARRGPNSVFERLRASSQKQSSMGWSSVPL